MELSTVEVELSKLHPAEFNPRTISSDRFQNLCESLQADRDMLLTRPVVALPDGTVIMGNMRVRAAQYLKWETIPTIFVDIDITKAKQWMLRDNNEFGEFNTDQLTEMLWELQEIGADVSHLGFTDEEIKKMFEGAGDANASSDTDSDQSGDNNVPQYEFDELVATGLLWAINNQIMHPMGFEVTIHMDDRQRAIGFSVIGDGQSPRRYSEQSAEDGEAKFNTFVQALKLNVSGMNILMEEELDEDGS